MTRYLWIIFAYVVYGLVSLPPVYAQDTEIQLNNWAEGAPGTDDGASRDYYNRVARLKWDNFMGDWADANGTAQGDIPWAETQVSTINTWAEWDVTSLVQAWLNGTYDNQGLFVRGLTNGVSFNFRSKEFAETAFRPHLVVEVNGTSTVIPVLVDTYLDESTFASLGDSQRLRVSVDRPTLVRFDLRGIDPGTEIDAATLKLYPYEKSGSGTSQIGIFRSNQTHLVPNRPVVMGLAEQFPGDVGIETHPEVVFVERWDQEGWEDQWTFVRHFYELTSEQMIDGRGLKVEVRQGQHDGINAVLRFKNELGIEPEEMYMRYYVRFHPDWNVQLQTGNKFPGWAGCEVGIGTGCNGGGASTGFNGWSERGHHFVNIPEGNPAANHVAIGTYDYNVDREGSFGTTTYWQDNYGGLLEKNRWHCIEFYIKMNTADDDETTEAGLKDGIMRAWVDGRLAYEGTNWRWRHVNRLKIVDLWFIVYHGGTEPAPENYHVYFDNLVVAKSYIGPRAENVGGDMEPPAAPENLGIQ